MSPRRPWPRPVRAALLARVGAVAARSRGATLCPMSNRFTRRHRQWHKRWQKRERRYEAGQEARLRRRPWANAEVDRCIASGSAIPLEAILCADTEHLERAQQAHMTGAVAHSPGCDCPRCGGYWWTPPE